MEEQIKPKLFPKAHLWLLIPFILTWAGFYISYWSKFNEAPFRQHVHGLTATAWYILVILQPWLIHNKPAKYHRKLGIIGILLAGGVVGSALLVMPYQVVNEFLPDVLKYGFSFGDICALTGFSMCVVYGIWNVKDISKHARWLISTVFWILLPATARLVYFPLLIAYDNNPPITYIESVYICLIVTTIIPLSYMMYLDYKNEKKVYRSYLFTLIGVTFYSLAIAPMGNWPWWIELCDKILGKGM